MASSSGSMSVRPGSRRRSVRKHFSSRRETIERMVLCMAWASPDMEVGWISLWKICISTSRSWWVCSRA